MPRRVASHDERRVATHRFGRLDLERVWLANIAIGIPAWWVGLFGDARALSYVVPQVLRFPERRSEIAKLRAEIEELTRIFRCVEVA
jgi:hypothetical protein